MYPHTLKKTPEIRTGTPRRLPWKKKKISTRDLVEFTRSFAVMVKARLPMITALETAQEEIRGSDLAQVLGQVHRAVQSGSSLSEALARHPDVFGGLYEQMARIGEASGVLDVVLLRLADHLEKTEALIRKIRLALIYPAMILTIALLATIFMLMVIVPTFAQMFQDFGANLPGPTKFILGLSDFIRQWFILIVLTGVGGIWLVRYLVSQPRGRAWWDRQKLGLPIMGPIVRNSLVARFAQTLGTLLSSGVVLLDSLEIISKSTENTLLSQDVDRMVSWVKQGKNLARPMRQSVVFPKMVTQMVIVGEETAQLDEMLLHVAGHYERRVDESIDVLTSVIEPVLIVVLGVVVGFLLVSMYLPIFQLVDVIGQ